MGIVGKEEIGCVGEMKQREWKEMNTVKNKREGEIEDGERGRQLKTVREGERRSLGNKETVRGRSERELEKE